MLRCVFLNSAAVCVCAGLLRMFFDVLLDEEVIQDEMFLSWESSADGKTLASVSNFFAWVREAKSQLG